VTKAVLLLDADGVALAPATLCAEVEQEARDLRLPLFDQVLLQLSGGLELRVNGGSCYELYEEGRCVGLIEVFEAPRGNRET
jgi:hypothetical protein